MKEKLIASLTRMSGKAVGLHLIGAVTTSYYWEDFSFQTEEDLIRFFVDNSIDSLNLSLDKISSIDDNYFTEDSQELIIHTKGLDIQVCTC